MKRYVAGFMFDDTLSKVAMIRKNKPEWQAGLLNGIGGKIEEGETAFDAMCREFHEEAGVITREWQLVCTLKFPYAEVEFFACKSSELLAMVESRTDEEVGIYHTSSCSLMSKFGGGVGLAIENIPPLIQLSIQRLTDLEGEPPQ